MRARGGRRPQAYTAAIVTAPFAALDALHLARAQFAFTMSFHFIFPAFSIGLASYLMVLEGLWLATRDAVYLALFRYWLKIFAIYQGYQADPTPEGVSRATTRTVVLSSLMVLWLEFVLTALMFR